MFDAEITSSKIISSLFRQLGIHNFQFAASYTQRLNYGRTDPRHDFVQVMIQQRGTCSSKHALLKHLAMENNWSGIELHMVIYAMDSANTPGIKDTLEGYNMQFIPEAHCVLSIDNQYLDITSIDSHANHWKDAILETRIIEPADTVTHKINWHRAYISQWIENNDIPYRLDEVWKIREACIEALSQP